MSNINLDGIGERINKIRKEQGLTIRELAEYTGYSVGFLSNLETKKSSPNVECLQRIAEVLQVDIIDLLTAERPHRVILRKEDRKTTAYPDCNMLSEKLDFGYGKQVYNFITIDPDAKKKGALSKHPFSEVGMVIEGVLTVDMEQNTYTLKEGDAIYIPEHTEHCLYNTGKVKSISYWVSQKN